MIIYNYLSSVPEDIDHSFREFLRKTLEKDHCTRLSAIECLAEPFLGKNIPLALPLGIYTHTVLYNCKYNIYPIFSILEFFFINMYF